MRSILASTVLPNKQTWVGKVGLSLGSDYVCLHSVSLVATHLVIFIHKFLLPFVSNLKVDQHATGILNTVGNKGGVAISFNVGENSLLFVSSHLSSGQSKFKRWSEDFNALESNLLKEEVKEESTKQTPFRVSE